VENAMLHLSDESSNINQTINPSSEGHHGHGSVQLLCITDIKSSRRKQRKHIKLNKRE
jgi:hypothetical protein